MRFTKVLSMSAVLFVSAAMMADQVSGLTFRYRLGGDWTTVTDGTTEGWGENPNNNGLPGIGLPGESDIARINFADNEVTVTTEVPAVDRLQIGVDEGGILVVENGGVLTTIRDLNVGHNGFVDGILDINDGGVVNVGSQLFMGRVDAISRGFLNINSGGVLNVESHLWLGGQGPAEVNISGTLNQANGILGLGSTDFNVPGGTATVNVMDGGELNLFNIHAGGTQLSIQPGSKIDITGSGRVTLPNNFVTVLEGYRDAGLLFGNGVAGAVDIAVENVAGGAGDFDGDNDVDGQDFLVWQRDPNVGDLINDWQANYGGEGAVQTVVTAAVPSLSAVASVPEPSALALVLVSSLAWCSCRRNRNGAIA